MSEAKRYSVLCDKQTGVFYIDEDVVPITVVGVTDYEALEQSKAKQIEIYEEVLGQARDEIARLRGALENLGRRCGEVGYGMPCHHLASGLMDSIDAALNGGEE